MKRVTITFDNGPEAAITHHCLDVLAKHNLKTTFFAVGHKLEDKANREALERAKAEGHWIGNHSYSHGRSLGSADASLFDEEVTRAQDLIGDLAGEEKLFRPFFNAGVMDNRIFKKSDIDQLVAGEYTVVFYDTLSGDWGDGEIWVNRALGMLEKRDWSSLILHDIVGYPDGYRTDSMLRLDEFLTRLKDRGIQAVQEFDPVHVAMRRGQILHSMDHLAN
jgi:peptidoglycan/xylan/chitin deacetylase (PgdA/CDA1 family)